MEYRWCFCIWYLNVLHKMMMYSTVCKANKNSDKQISEFITAGFTGQLKGWWDNIMTSSQRLEILNFVKIVPSVGVMGTV